MPRRESIRTEVLSRRPVDARERHSQAAFLSAFDTLPRPFDEDAAPTHVTASAIVVGERGVVLHRHKRLGIWLQPGGHIDDREFPADAAVREAREETGLPVALASGDLVHVDVHPGPRGHTHLDLRYLVRAAPVDPAPPQGESQDVRWWTWADAIRIADPGLEGVLRALQPGEPVWRRAVVADALALARVSVRSRWFADPISAPTSAGVDDEADVAGWMRGSIEAEEAWVAEIDGVVVAGTLPGHEFVDPTRRPAFGHKPTHTRGF
jgi:8-oxo-dGTP pyrophosphatase MutT (NUDIX family)